MEAINFSVELLALLLVVSMIAGLIDTLAGGGGLITLPVLILAGFSPISALATNKLQGSMGTATATLLLLRNKRMAWSAIKPTIVYAFIGSAIGTIAVQFIDTKVLSLVVPIALTFIAIYFLVSPMPKEQQGKAMLSDTQYKTTVIPAIGFYDGLFGPGTGSFFSLAGVACKGYGLVYATALAKPLNLSTNVASLIVFIAAGQVVWIAGLMMMFGQMLGAWIGSHFLFKINPSYLRMVVVVMCIGMLIKYCYSMGWINI